MEGGSSFRSPKDRFYSVNHHRSRGVCGTINGGRRERKKADYCPKCGFKCAVVVQTAREGIVRNVYSSTGTPYHITKPYHPPSVFTRSPTLARSLSRGLIYLGGEINKSAAVLGMCFYVSEIFWMPSRSDGRFLGAVFVK